MREREFVKIVTGTDARRKAEAYLELAEKVVDHLAKYEWMKRFVEAKPGALADRDDILQELILFAFEKEKKFDPAKGQAIAYFTTIMSGWCHCNCRAPQSRPTYNQLVKKYRQFLESKYANEPARKP